MKMRKVLGLAAGLLLIVSLVLSSCGAEEESAPELPPAELTEEICYGYSFGVPDYYSSNGFVINKDIKEGERVSEIDGQAALRITSKYSELEADEFSGKALEESGIADGLGAAELTTEEMEIAGMPGMKASCTNPDGNEVRAILFLNEDYKSITAVSMKEYSSETEKEHAYIDDFDLIPESIRTVGPEEHMAALGYTIDFPEYYEKFVPYIMGSDITYFCYAGADANTDVTISEGAGADSLDRSEAGLEDSLRFDEETGIDISISDDIEKGPARIRQYSYSFSGMAAGGEGAFIYDTDKDILISINLMESGNGDKDYSGDFRKMIRDLGVE